MDEVRQEIEGIQNFQESQDAYEQGFEDIGRADGNERTDRQQLNKLFSDFNRVASALDESYQVLEERVSSLKRELSETRLAHQWDQAEKDRLANRLASLVSVLPSAVLILNKYGLIIDRNPLASGALNEPLIGLSWEDVLKREGVSECSPQNEIRLPDGRIFSVARDGLAVSSDSAVFLTDVTDIHKAQHEMARNKRLTEMGEMASSMAHQIRTPLSAAHLYMSPLGRADLPQEERIETVAKIQDRLSHIGKLIDSMLGFVRGSRSVLKQVRVQEVLDMVGSLVSSETENVHARLSISNVAGDIYVEADVDALVGALSNIVLNAFEVSEERPEVNIEVNVLDPAMTVEIKIKDKGPGIEQDKLERIFDPFYTTRSTGTGLGLAIAAVTCKEHGGSVYACNRTAGGAEFVVSLPVLDLLDAKGAIANKSTRAEDSGIKTMNSSIQREVA